MSEEQNNESTLDLSSLSPASGSRKKRKRVGVGEGSGNGKTCGKGHKGQKSRSGARIPAGFEGGQMPLHRRLPKVGFTSRKRLRGVNVFSLVSTAALEATSASGELTLDVLKESGLIPSQKRKVKILGGTELSKAIVVEAHAVSKSAREAIEKAGGSVRIVS